MRHLDVLDPDEDTDDTPTVMMQAPGSDAADDGGEGSLHDGISHEPPRPPARPARVVARAPVAMSFARAAGLVGGLWIGVFVAGVLVGWLV